MRKLAITAIFVVLAAACGSSGNYGDLGTILGSPSPSNPSSIVGTVNSVDTGNQIINVNVSYVNNLRNTQNNQVIYYDSRTRVVYQGNNNYRPEDLERGDQIEISGVNDRGHYVAETVTVTRNVRQ